MSQNTNQAGVYIPVREDAIIAAGGAMLGAANAEAIIPLVGGEEMGSFDIRGTFSATFVIEASSDNGVNYIAIEAFNPLTQAYTVNITTAGIYEFNIAAYGKVRIRCSAYTSGSALVNGRASFAGKITIGEMLPANLSVTLLTAANTAGTLTIPAVAGMRHYITHIDVTRINGTAVAVAGTALLSVTTTNLNGSPAYSSGNALAVGESKVDYVADFSHPLISTTAGTSTTIVAPAGGAGIQYRINVSYYLGV